MNKKTPETSRRKPRTAPSRAKSKSAPDSQPVAETTVAVRELMIGGRDYSSLCDGRRLEVNVGDGVLSIRRKQGCVMKTLVDGAPLKLPAAEPVVTDVTEPPAPLPESAPATPDSATETSIPSTEQSENKPTPGWDMILDNYREKAFTIGFHGIQRVGSHVREGDITRGFNSQDELITFLKQLAEDGKFTMLADIRTNNESNRPSRHAAMRILEQYVDSVRTEFVLQTIALYGFDKNARLRAVSGLCGLGMRKPLESLVERDMPNNYCDPDVIEAAQNALKTMGNPVAQVDTPTAEPVPVKPVPPPPLAVITPAPSPEEQPGNKPASGLSRRSGRRIDTLRHIGRFLNRIPEADRIREVPAVEDLFGIEQVIRAAEKELKIGIGVGGKTYDISGDQPREISVENYGEKLTRRYTCTETVPVIDSGEADVRTSDGSLKVEEIPIVPLPEETHPVTPDHHDHIMGDWFDKGSPVPADNNPAKAPKETFSEQAEQHAAPAYFAPPGMTSASTTPTLVTPALKVEPKIEVPFLEAETKALKVDDVQAAELARIEELRGKVGKLEERFASLDKQAQRLLKGVPDISDTDIPTIITVFNDLKTETADLLNGLLADAVSNKGLIGRLKQLLDKDIKRVLVELHSKQQNGVETDFSAGGKAGSEVAVIPVGARRKHYNERLLVAAGIVILGLAVGIKTCANSDSSKSDEQKLSAPVALPEESVPAPVSAPMPPLPTEQPTSDLNLEPVGTAELPATTTTTFNCEVDTTDTALIECVEQGAPDADVTENLAWTGPYSTETGTVPAEVTLKTPDGQQFVATFNAQIGTRQKLSWTLEAVKAE